MGSLRSSTTFYLPSVPSTQHRVASHRRLVNASKRQSWATLPPGRLLNGWTSAYSGNQCLPPLASLCFPGFTCCFGNWTEVPPSNRNQHPACPGRAPARNEALFFSLKVFPVPFQNEIEIKPRGQRRNSVLCLSGGE